ncbi:hypothetical protein M413DRAFT_439155 [Hebeloma cylindrosporum]|uniref:Alpha/beta hydrolase fold-3 domain-containing protein n=1 Tax=Hebeloma cylindrosporum TaxID=76867 RepID=A0A0C3CTR5_HEBCY|nr:hypothetical protein M413DRAFT_439155 [Hebeloma cylindrosporum h7]
MLMSIGGLVPLPSDALVSPVTFKVRRRNLRGILMEFDAKETGKRELSGEWVVGRKTWQRMQTDWKAANKSDPALNKSTTATPSMNTPLSGPTPLKRKERVILYIHGGAYYLSSAAAQRIISIPLAKYTDCRVFAVDYRLAPETCFPGPLHDVVSAYLRLVDDLHIPPENIIVAGDSAGGGLSLALLMYLRDNEYALPSGAILMSPWVDLTMSCESWDSNAPYDVVPFPTAENHMNPIALYLGEHTERYLTHPYASPLFGDFKGLPPLLIQAGDCEVLRDEITLLAHKATLAGVQVMHELYEDAIHVFQAYPFLESSMRSFESMRSFIRFLLPQYQSRSPQLLAAIAEKGMEREIETDRSVVVRGDGVEEPASFESVQEFGKNKRVSTDGGSSRSKSGGSADKKTDTDEDSDAGPSWVRSPASQLEGDGSVLWDTKNKEEDDFEHIEDVDVPFDDIPQLDLSPPLIAPVPHHASSILPQQQTRPPLSTFSSSSSLLSCASPIKVGVSPRPTGGPRRIQSTSSLSAFALHCNRSLAHSASPIPTSDTNSPRSFSFDLRNTPLMPRTRSRSKSTTLLAPPDFTMAKLEEFPLPSPSIRKKRFSLGLNMTSSRGSKALSSMFETGLKSPTSNVPSSSDVEALVDDWTRLGPANQTVVVSATTSNSGR